MRILVVEDEHKIAQSIRKGLEQEHYAVDVVYTGTEGLDYAVSESYDLIILDRLLPGMEGVAVTQAIRERGVHIPILILTALGQVEDRVKGLDTGADDYLTKPFAFTELLARVRALTRRPREVNGTMLTLDDLTLNTVAYEVKRGEKEIPLSAKEYALLEYLLRHKGSVLTKEQIISHVWNYDADVLPNSVEVYIKHLRKKIDSLPGRKQLIHTVRGFGYKISG